MAGSCTRLEYFKRFRCPTYADLGAKIGVVGNTARRYCQPENAPGWLWMNASAARELKRLTGGVIHAGNYSEQVCETVAAAMLSEIDARTAVEVTS